VAGCGRQPCRATERRIRDDVRRLIDTRHWRHHRSRRAGLLTSVAGPACAAAAAAPPYFKPSVELTPVGRSVERAGQADASSSFVEHPPALTDALQLTDLLRRWWRTTADSRSSSLPDNFIYFDRRSHETSITRETLSTCVTNSKLSLPLPRVALVCAATEKKSPSHFYPSRANSSTIE